MTAIRDQRDDTSGRQLYRLVTENDAPEFVKEASSVDVYGNENLPHHLYGDPVRRKFPCHTASATWLSNAFYLDNRNDMPPKLAEWIGNRIKSYAEKFHIDTEIDKVIEKHASVDKVSEPDDKDFAYVVRLPDGTKDRHMPLRNASEVKLAAAFLVKHRSAFDFDNRKSAAVAIIDKANAYGVSLGEIDEEIEKYACMGFCAPEDASALLTNRANVLKALGKSDDVCDHLEKMASICLNNRARAVDPHSLSDLAYIVNEVDRAYGLDKAYGDVIKRPEDILFSLNGKLAAKIIQDNCQMPSGNVYCIDDFNKLSVDDVRDMMGTDFAESVTDGSLFLSPAKVADIAPTLPRSDANLFEKLLTASDVQPVYKEAGTPDWSVDYDTWKELAAVRSG